MKRKIPGLLFAIALWPSLPAHAQDTGDTPVASEPVVGLPERLDGPASGPATLLAVLDAEASFGRYSTELGVAGRDALERLLAQLDPLEELLSIRVTGHADSRGNDEDNLLLSFQRAEAVATLVRERVPGTRVVATGLGEAFPIADNRSAEGRALNRRVEIQVLAIGRAPQ